MNDDAKRASKAAQPSPAATDARRKLMQAGPESTITLMVESGQAPGNPVPGRTPAAPPPPVGVWARLRASIKSWF